MFTEKKRYRLGKKTFLAFFFAKNKVLLFVFAILSLISYEITFGIFKKYTENYLEKNVSYISVSLVELWLILFLVSYLIVVFLRANVFYRQYSFIFHKHAFHVRHGLFFIKEHVIPYSQIMNVEIKRPVLYMLFGLVELDIVTGLSDSDVGLNKKGEKISLLPVLDKNLAENIMHELVRLSAVHNGYDYSQESKQESDKSKRRRKRK